MENMIALNLLQNTVDLLKQMTEEDRVITKQQIHEELGVSLRWLTKMANNGFTDPGILNVQKLYIFLKAKQEG